MLNTFPRSTTVEIYDEPDATAAQDGDEDEAADDRIAEQFRREFMDAISSRRSKHGPSTAAKRDKRKAEGPKGPKLGGSRSARAAMREREMAEKAKGKK